MKVLLLSSSIVLSSLAFGKAAPATTEAKAAPATTEAAHDAKAAPAAHEAKAVKAEKAVAAVPAAECAKLQDACKTAGLKGTKLTDCVAKVAKGETVKGVTVTAEDAAACQAKLAPVK